MDSQDSKCSLQAVSLAFLGGRGWSGEEGKRCSVSATPSCRHLPIPLKCPKL